MTSLFDSKNYTPLASLLRPQVLADVVGQDHLLSPTGPLGAMIKNHQLLSCILWGPAGCGKTTIAMLLAKEVGFYFEQISATFTGVADVRKVFAAAQSRRMAGQGTVLFVDEIHRFTRAQQDIFLPFVEDGTIVLVGATTENPSFELNSALLSRCKVLTLNRHTPASLAVLLDRAQKKMDFSLNLSPENTQFIMQMADGDGRYFLNLLETLFAARLNNPSQEQLVALLQKKAPAYDKDKDNHYNLISALHKSLRGSDPDAGLYWLARMITGGEDVIYILRRLTRFAAEDVGLSDPQALPLAIAAWETYRRLGSPEGDLAVAELVVYLATAPKSTSVYRAWNKVKAFAQQTDTLMPPKHILNAPTRLMKELNYGKDYQYDPDTPDGFSGQDYFPEGIGRQSFYTPVERGFEREIQKRLTYWNHLREKKKCQK